MVARLKKNYPNVFGFSVSHTTRKPRKGEVDGVDYHFIEKEQMLNEIKEEKFLETVEYSGNYYGTSFRAVEDIEKQGKICILEIDIAGCELIKKRGMDARFYFIQPPSMEELKRRLIERNSENEETVNKRLEIAKEEMKYLKVDGFFDHIILNDNVDRAYNELVETLKEDLE